VTRAREPLHHVEVTRRDRARGPAREIEHAQRLPERESAEYLDADARRCGLLRAPTQDGEVDAELAELARELPGHALHASRAGPEALDRDRRAHAERVA